MKLSDKQQKCIEKLMAINGDNEIFWDDANEYPKFIKGVLSSPSTEEPESIARSFIDDIDDLLHREEALDEELRLSHVERDAQGFHHLFFSQILKGIPVFEGSTQVHINPEGVVVAYKDYRLTKITVPVKPQVTRATALNTVVTDIDRPKSQVKTNAKLVFYRDGSKELHLAWEVEWIGKEDLGASYHLIDAHNGLILFKYTQVREALSRKTYSANNGSNLKAKLLLTDNQTTSDSVAQSAHDHVARVYTYFKDTFGRDSYDAGGAILTSTVHYKKNYNNAFWSDWHRQMVYGDGDGYTWKPLAYALDIVGHEMTHAVTSRTARFVYAEEAGALDESFADFFGVMISNDDPVTDWNMGEGVYTPYRSGDALRDMSDPVKYDQPDHMDSFIRLKEGELPDPDKNDNGYVHSNSGIPNKVAYLIVDGGIHHGITVRGIGRKKAEQIYYLALTVYLSSATSSRWTFTQARYALLNACRQLYGDDGDEYAAIKNGWAAAGVGEPASDFVVIQKGISPNRMIPDNDSAGIVSSILFDEEGLIKELSVDLDIEHTYIGDLRVILTSPAGEAAILHDRDGRSAHDIKKICDLSNTPQLMTFTGDQLKGEWKLTVSDHARMDTGRLLFWALKATTMKVEKKELDQELSPSMAIPDNYTKGLESAMTIS